MKDIIDIKFDCPDCGERINITGHGGQDGCPATPPLYLICEECGQFVEGITGCRRQDCHGHGEWRRLDL